MTPRSPKRIPYKMKKLGTYLKKLREEFGWSIRQAAKQTNVSPSYLSKIEAGDTFQSIGVEILIRLSKIYIIPVNEILKEAGFIKEEKDEFPDFTIYLRGKFHMPPHAIRDMEMAKEIVEKKYKIS